MNFLEINKFLKLLMPIKKDLIESDLNKGCCSAYIFFFIFDKKIIFKDIFNIKIFKENILIKNNIFKNIFFLLFLILKIC